MSASNRMRHDDGADRAARAQPIFPIVGCATVAAVIPLVPSNEIPRLCIRWAPPKFGASQPGFRRQTPPKRFSRRPESVFRSNASIRPRQALTDALGYQYNDSYAFSKFRSPRPFMANGTAPQTLWHQQGVRVPTCVFATSGDAVQHVVLMIENLIRERQSGGLPCVLGLPTGSTPVSVYRQLVRLHKEQRLDFSNVTTFNLDEYYPMKPTELQSYHRFMRENFFDHVNIRPENIHIPDGSVAMKDVDKFCEQYEYEIRRAGGIDLLLLGIG